MSKGLQWALITMLISGLSVFANGQLVKGIDPIVHTTIKNLLVGVMVFGLLLFRKKLSLITKLPGKEWGKLLAIAVVGGSVSFGLFFTGLKIVGASDGALIHKTLVLWVTLMAVGILKEKLSVPLILAALGLYGANFIGGVKFGTLSAGHAMVLAATLLWSVETIMVKRWLAKTDQDVLLLGRMGLGSLMLLAFMLLQGKAGLVMNLRPDQWMNMFLVSLLLFGYVTTWYRALKLAPASAISSILVGATVITTLLTSLVTGKFQTTQALQGLAISIGVGVVVGQLMAFLPKSNKDLQMVVDHMSNDRHGTDSA